MVSISACIKRICAHQPPAAPIAAGNSSVLDAAAVLLEVGKRTAVTE
jgi:hypothetical protein